MLERGSYIPWASRFRRYLNRKRDNRKWLLKALDEGPYVFRQFTPTGAIIPRLETVDDLEGDDLLYYDAEMEVMNLILLSIPNKIYNSVDSCTSAKDMWKRVEHLMRGTIQNQVDRETRFTNEFDQFITEPGESLVSVYNCFAQLMNDLERNNMKFPTQLTIDSFDDLFDYLLQFEKLVNASREKKLEKSHDPLALVAHTGSSSRNTSSYYVTHPSSVVDYDEEYKQDDVHNHSEDPLASAMLLLAKAITQNFSNLTNNRLRASSNTQNQAIVQGDRVNIQSRNSGNIGRNNRYSYVQEEVVEGMNASNETGNVQRALRTPTSGNTSTVQCYNCSGKGHYTRNCPKPRVHDSKYFMEQMLLAKQDEAGVILTDEQKDFLFADSSRMEEIEELSANICLMARIQPADQNSNDGTSYKSAFISEVQSSSINEIKGNFNSGSIEKDAHVYDLCALETLARSAYEEAAKQQQFAQKVQQQNMTLTSQLELYKENNRILENITKDNNYLNEFLEADERAKHFHKQAQSQLICDRDIIRDLKKQRDTLNLEILETKTMPSESPLINELYNIKVGFEKLSLLIQQNSKRASIFYTSKAEIEINDFCQDQVKPILNELQVYLDAFQNLFQRDIKEMKDAFEQNDVYLDEIERQNDLLKDQLLEASLKHDIELCVLLNHECVDKTLNDELEQVKKKSLKIQKGLKARIKILEKDVQRCEKQSVDFELKLQHEKEKHKWDSSKNKNSKPLDYSWISRMEKLENENVSLDFKVQSLIKERDDVKMEYKKLFDSIKKTRSQTQMEMDELIAHVSEKTYAYGAIRAENQNLLSTISELKASMKNGENGKSVNTKFDKTNGSQSFLCVTPLNKNAFQKQMVVSKTKENHVASKPDTLQTSPHKQIGANQNTNVIRPGIVRRLLSRDSHVKNIVLDVSKNTSKKEEVYVRKNTQTDNTFANVDSNRENVIDVDVANASKVKTLLCVSCMQNVLIPCHDKCVAKHKLNVRSNARRTFSTTSRIPKSSETTFVAPKTKFSKKETQSKSLDTTFVVFKYKIVVESASNAKDKAMAIIYSNITICHVYYVEGLGHNLFSVGQFCDGDLEVAFRSNTCYVRNLEGDDLLTGEHDSNLYTISISDMAASSPVCLMSKATSTKSLLWHRRLSPLNFGTINDLTRLDLVDGLPKFKYGKDHLCSACERGKGRKLPIHLNWFQEITLN
ncbi:integrase, catalytic region, zinc finger, CCHC-type containing protein [Tanacetum coccineum]